jgi:hypothetical protein
LVERERQRDAERRIRVLVAMREQHEAPGPPRGQGRTTRRFASGPRSAPETGPRD